MADPQLEENSLGCVMKSPSNNSNTKHFKSYGVLASKAPSPSPQSPIGQRIGLKSICEPVTTDATIS